MKRIRKVKKPVPLEESTDASDTEEIPSLQVMKKEKAVTRKTKNTKPIESSDSEGKSKSKLPVKNIKEEQKMLVESSDCIKVAGTSLSSYSEEIPSILKRKVRVKKANVPVPEDNSDTTVKSLLLDNVLQNIKKRPTKRTSSTTEPSDNSDSDVKPQKLKIKGKKFIKKKQTTSNDSDSEEKKPLTTIKKKRMKKEVIKKEENDSDSEEKPQIKKKILKKEVINKEETASNDSDESGQDAETETATHVKDLEDLRTLDPEFYNFLYEHDSKLLKFEDDSLERIPELEREDYDDHEDDDDHEDAVLGSEQQDQVHVPSDLHGGSDESDFEAEDTKPKDGNVTLKMVHDLQNELQKSKIKLGSISKAVKLFTAAVLRATSDDGTTEGEYNVAGSSVFNAVLNMCVLYLPDAMKNYLGFEASGKDPRKCKHFVKIRSSLIEYFTGLLKLLRTVTSDSIVTIMLKHLYQLCPYLASFLRVSNDAIKMLLPLWSTREETIRVLSFICILRITRSHQRILLIPVLKAMFMTYMKNCKFVSPTTWPGINFMRRSLLEMFTLDLKMAYAHVFLYVRQLGILLRNAIVVPRVDNKRAVFNWQYLNALHLFAELISQNGGHSGIKALNFPLVMIISNSIKLGPTAEYYPLRFYLIEMLLNMGIASGQMLTIMPFLIDVTNKFEINKKHKRASMKPLDFSCIIRLSRSQMSESAFKDAVVDRFYAVVLAYTASLSYRMMFPDCSVVLILFFRGFVAKCNNSNHKKKLKQLLDKIVENSDYIIKQRRTFDGHLAELPTVVAWENQIKAQGTPLSIYYENWRKLNKIQKRKAITENDELAGWLPVIKRRKRTSDETDKLDSKESGPVNLFPSDSEDDNIFEGVKDEKIAIKKEVTKPIKVKKVKKEKIAIKKEVTKPIKVKKVKKEKITIKKEVTKANKVKKEKTAIKKEVTKKKKSPKKVLKASNSDELEMADTGDVVSEFSW